jgi:hypothetical protein
MFVQTVRTTPSPLTRMAGLGFAQGNPPLPEYLAAGSSHRARLLLPAGEENGAPARVVWRGLIDVRTAFRPMGLLPESALLPTGDPVEPSTHPSGQD